MSEHRVTVQRTIAAPVEDVWAVIDNTARYAEWVDGALEVRHHHGQATVGQTYEERNRTVGPLTTVSTWTVREVETDRLRVDTAVGFAPLQDMANIFRFAPAEGGRATEMTYEVTFRLGLGPVGKVVGALLGKSLSAQFAQSMANLDELLRSERPPGSGGSAAATTALAPARSKPSLPMRAAGAYLGFTKTKKVLGDVVATEIDRLQNKRRGPAVVSSKVRRTHQVDLRDRDGLRCVEISVRNANPDTTIVYAHGGGYLNPAVARHWNLMATLAEENNARVIAPLYPLAPEGTAATVIPMLAGLHTKLTADFGSAPVWAGDSAGGGLALATALHLRDHGLPLPRHLVLFAPWLDVELANPGISEVIDRDPTLDIAGLRYAGILWAGDSPTSAPAVSPGRGTMAGLPPITMIVGTRDIFGPDCRSYAARARAAGVDIALLLGEGGFHVYPAATFLPESVAARKLISARLRESAVVA